MALENAAEQGEMFLKIPAREMKDYITGMGESELRMFRLGAKQAILEKMDTLPVGSDSVKRLFGKNGDVSKLRDLFPSNEAFNSFAKTLEREANFSMTRRAAQGNSTTVQQLFSSRDSAAALESAANLLTNPASAAAEARRIFAGLASKKGERAYVQALEKAGDILLESGMDPARLQNMLRRGDMARIQGALQNVLLKPATPTITATQAATATSVLPGLSTMLEE
jgi:hypothetical protein